MWLKRYSGLYRLHAAFSLLLKNSCFLFSSALRLRRSFFHQPRSMPALSSRAAGAGIDPARVRTACSRQASESVGTDARHKLTELLVKRAAALDVLRMLGRAEASTDPVYPKREVNKSYSL